MAARKKPFEQSITRLEEIVARLERGETTLEESISLFEEGTKLAAACARQLEQAEQKVMKLSRGPDGTPVEQPFEEQS